MTTPPKRNLEFDPTLASYKPFFDNGWKVTIGKLTAGTVLAEAVIDLAASWEGVSGTQQMPSVLMHVLDGAWQASFSPDNLDHLIGMFLERLRHLAGEVNNSVVPALMPTQKGQVNQVVTKVANDIDKKARGADQRLPSDKQWPELMEPGKDKLGLHLSLWGAQRLCYCGVYYAFEEYLRFVIGALRKEPDYEIWKLKDAKKDAEAILTKPVVDGIIDETVTIAQLVRNAVVHAGGRETPKLVPYKKRHGIRVTDGYLQIFPGNTKDLYDILKARTLELTKAALPKL